MDEIKLAKEIIKKYAQLTGRKGLVVEGEKVAFKDVYRELSEYQGKPKVRRCQDCENFYRAPNKRQGVCMPKSYSLTRDMDDFCTCNFIPKSPERRKMDETINRLASKKRT